MPEQFANQVVGAVLSGAINDLVTSLVVNSASGFPSDGNFSILIDSELLTVTGVSGTTFTVARGEGDTSAASHASGATVKVVQTQRSQEAAFALLGHYRITTPLEIPNNSDTVVTWETSVTDESTFSSGGMTKLTAPKDGKYHLDASYRWEASGGGGARFMQFKVDGAFILVGDGKGAEPTAGFTGDIYMHSSCVLRLTAGQFVEVNAFQNSGAGLDIVGNFSMTFLGD